MVDTEGRPIFSNSLRETDIKTSPVTNGITTGSVNSRVSRSGENEGLVNSRISQNLVLTSPRAVNITSPRTRDNVMSVIHGSQEDIDQISRGSSQTPVEFVQRNDRRQNNDVGRTNTQDALNQTRRYQNGYTNNGIDSVERTYNVESRLSTTDAFNVLRSTDIQSDGRSTTNNAQRVTVAAVRNNEETVNNRSSHRNSNASSVSTNMQRNTELQQTQYNASFNQNGIRESHNDRYSAGYQDRYDHSDSVIARHSGRHSDRHHNRRSFREYGSNTNTERVRSHRSRSVSSGRTRSSSGRQRVRSARTISTFTDEEEKDERYVVPALPLPLAIVCCVLNFAIPGLGTMIASVGVLCCAKTEDMNFKEKCGSCCTVFGIGFLQLLLVACFLIGWIWSCIWGITFIGMSKNYYQAEEEQNPSIPAWERNMIGRTPLPEPQIVENQPYPGIGYDDLRRAYEERRRRRQERQQQQRRSRSRLSDFIYPMRAPSNMAYQSPPPPYEDATGQPNNRSLDVLAANLEEARRHENTERVEWTGVPEGQVTEAFRPMNSIIHEEA